MLFWLIFLLGCIQVSTQLNPAGLNVCEKTVLHKSTIYVNVTYYSKETYKACCFLDTVWGCALPCNKTRIVKKFRLEPRVINGPIILSVCCPGWMQQGDHCPLPTKPKTNKPASTTKPPIGGESDKKEGDDNERMMEKMMLKIVVPVVVCVLFVIIAGIVIFRRRSKKYGDQKSCENPRYKTDGGNNIQSTNDHTNAYALYAPAVQMQTKQEGRDDVHSYASLNYYQIEN